MKQPKRLWGHNPRSIAWAMLGLVIVAALLLYRLGSLTHGLSSGEIQTATAAVGWHGMYRSPLDLPLKIIRSIVFYISPGHGQTLTRLPNALLGGLAIASFTWLTWLWHGRRTALLSSALFATSAWVLHVSRLASFDVTYLWATVTLLLGHTLLNRYTKQAFAWFGVLATWGFLLTIPGMVWFVVADTFLLRSRLKTGWQSFGTWWQRLLSIAVFILWLPLLTIDFTRSGQVALWLGLPTHLGTISHLAKQFIGVFVHLFIRGPEYPTLWLGRATLLDAFTLAMCALGVYFYATHWQTSRSHLLEAFFAIGVILVTLNGPVSFSVLVPFLYVVAAMGVAYLLHEWLLVFPRNPLARGIGIYLVAIAVGISCIYNLRAYFIAWPHDPTTQSIFRYHR